MLTGETVLLVAHGRWTDWNSGNELAMRFARSNRVVVVEPPPRFEIFGYQKGFLAYLRCFQLDPARHLSDNLTVVGASPMLPLAVSLLSRAFRREIAGLSIELSKLVQRHSMRRQLRAIKAYPTILFLSEPMDLLLAGHFGENVTCYRPYDEIGYFYSNRYVADVIEAFERRHIAKADVVFASSRSQYQKRVRLHSNVYLAPNGANFEQFNSVLSLPGERPTELRRLKPPILGYIGTVDYRVDFDLLRLLATGHPDWTLVLAGPVRDYCRKQVQELSSFANVRFVGQLDHSIVHQYVKYFDIGLIPFLVNPSTNTMWPCKLNEYLAAGKPVVSTNLFEVRAFAEVVRLARDHQEFIEMVGEEIGATSSDKTGRRVGVARQYNWDKIFGDMSDGIERAMTRKRACDRQ